MKQLNEQLKEYLIRELSVGIFEHFYENSHVSSKIPIHYVVVAFQVLLGLNITKMQLGDYNKF